ncbi:type II toxin-antitoxin system RelE/ParE family toxin, partial [Flavihumibacter sp. ZG627]|uniref:type II toxin-antitoxin system RelE/ParE family toxin n=1 Tax=Flavihumibacter sp. ZG627 TaxID=1463156 RepID=UPI00057D19C0
MSYNVQVTAFFERELKALAKKHRSLKNDLAVLIEQLELEPTTGTDLGNSCYKIRLAITSKGKGKSGGARVITHVKISGSTVYLLSIYDKSELENISDNTIKE